MKLSVIIPAYNEESRIAETLRDVDAYLNMQKYQSEIIVMVNGSSDRTFEITNKIAASDIKKIIPVNLRQGGKGNAVKRGILDHASGDIIMFMDADNATPISEVEKFLPFFGQDYGLVIGSRYLDPKTVKIRQSLYKVVLSRLSNILIQLLAAPGIRDTQLGFKAFTKECAKDIFRFVTISRWGFDMEVLTVARIRGYRIKEIAVSWTEHGGGHVPLKAYFESLLDLLKIKIKAIKGDYNK